jgi:phosphonate transport system substrate-binding protein
MLLLVWSLLVALSGCSKTGQEGARSAESSAAGETMPARLTMAMVPAEDNEQIAETFEPMRKYLEDELGRPVDVSFATDYASVIEAMKQKKVDLAWFGPLSYVLAEREAGAVAFAIGVKEGGGSTYYSYFVVPGDSPARTLDDLAGKSVAFVDPASTSGGLVPTYIIRQKYGKTVDEFFDRLIYAGSHNAAELAVKNKTVDAAATDSIVYERMLAKGLIAPETNRILHRSDPLPGSLLTYRSDLARGLKEQIQELIVSAHKHIDVTGYDNDIVRYDKADPSNYDVIRNMVRELNLTNDQLL